MPHPTPKKPRAFSIRKEWTGKPEPRLVLRFRGHVAAEASRPSAILKALRQHEAML